MYLSILTLPLLGSLISGFIGRKIGVTGAQFITITCLIISSILASIAFYEVGLSGSPVYINLGSWIDSEFLLINWEFTFDQITVAMLIPVLYISTLIHIYSISYMSEDPHIPRFFAYLSGFTAGMLLILCSGNYFVLFVGWEAIGIFSYLLISYYFTRIQAVKSGFLALVMNRVGDMGVSIGFFGMFALFGSVNYSTLFNLTPFVNETAITIIALLIFTGTMAKSAQLPLVTWLSNSMEGPTPVSALLHAATLVTAGIFILLRSSPILEFSPTALLVITLVGATTAFFAATIGVLQNDLKRIIAFSTISQLGYMVLSIGLSQYSVSLFHTVNHAFFKALLFLSAGQAIHSILDQQDIRRMGGLKNFLPFVYSVMIVGSLSLMAIPFLSGFYSKDLILELAFSQYSFSGLYAYILGTISAALTAFYSFRLISLVFLTVPNASRNTYLNTHESTLSVIIPLLILALFSIFFGYIFADLFVGIGSDFFGNSLFTHPNNIHLIEAEFSLPIYIKLAPLILSILGGFLGIFLYHKNVEFLINLTNNLLGRKIYTFLNAKYLLDVIYNHYFTSLGLKLGYNISKLLDRGVIELLGPHGISSALTNTGINISKLDTGIITTYSIYITLSLLSLISLVFAPILIETSLLSEIRLIIIYISALLIVLLPTFNNKE